MSLSRHTSRSLAACRAFTLVELMLVSALVGLVMATSATMIWQADGARRRAERSADAWTEADAAFNAITEALDNIYRPTVDDTKITFEGTDGTLNDQPADRVRFMTISYHHVRLGQPESDAREVEFSLIQEPGDPTPSLARRLDPTLNLTDDVGGVIDHLARNVAMLDIRYFDGSSWYDDWPLEYNALPLAMRVTIRVVVENWNPSDTHQPRTLTLTRLIYPPRMPPFEPANAQQQQQPQNNDNTNNNTQGLSTGASGSSASFNFNGAGGGGRE